MIPLWKLSNEALINAFVTFLCLAFVEDEIQDADQFANFRYELLRRMEERK